MIHILPKRKIGMKHLKVENFKDFVSTEERVIVEFGAEWCGPCRAMEPTLERMSSENPGRVGKVDVDDQATLAATFGIRNIPTVIAFQGGKALEKKVGLLDESTLKKMLEN